MTDNRRRSRRARHDSALELSGVSGRPLPLAFKLVDVSDHGLCFSTTLSIEVGTPLRGKLRTLDRGPRAFAGRVVWKRREKNALLYGLSFEGSVPLPPIDERLGGSE